MLGAGLLSVLLLSVVRRKLNIAKTVYCWVLQSRGSSYCWVQPSSHHYPPPSTTPVCQCSTPTTGLIVALLPACATNHYFVPNMARLTFNTIKQRQRHFMRNIESRPDYFCRFCSFKSRCRKAYQWYSWCVNLRPTCFFQKQVGRGIWLIMPMLCNIDHLTNYFT